MSEGQEGARARGGAPATSSPASIRNKENGVDIEMAMDIADRLHDVQPPGILVIASGDADYVPAIERARKRDWKGEVWLWDNAATDLKKAASKFQCLDPKFEFLRLGGGAVM